MAEFLSAAMEVADQERDRIFGRGPDAVACFDQFGSRFRETMKARFGVDLADRDQLRAAFAGAYSIAEYLMGLTAPNPVVSGIAAEVGVYPLLAAFAGLDPEE